MTQSASTSSQVTTTASVVDSPTATMSPNGTTSASTTVTVSSAVTSSKSATVIPPTNVTVNIGANATVALGAAVPLPILQRVTIQQATEGSAVLQAVAGMALTSPPGTEPDSSYPPYNANEVHIVSVLSLTPESMPSYTPEPYGDVLPVAVCAMIAQRSVTVPYAMALVTLILNTSTGALLTQGSGLNQIKMPSSVPLDNVPVDYGGYALYQLVLQTNAAPVVLLVRPTTLVFLSGATSTVPYYSVPTQVVTYNRQPYTINALLPYSTMSRLLVLEGSQSYVLVYTRDGTDICATAVYGIAGSGAVNITALSIPFQLVDNDSRREHAAIVGGCLQVGSAARSDFINAIVSDYDEGAAEDGWLSSADHKTVSVPPGVMPLPSFVFRTSKSCTVVAVQLVQSSAGSNVTLPSYVMIAGDLVTFTACSDTPPVVLSSRIFGSPVDPVDFPFALMVWGGALSLVNTSGGEIMSTILAPGNASQQTLLLPFWMPPVDSATPNPLPATGIQRLPFLMVRDNLLELVELQAGVSSSYNNLSLTLEQVSTQDIHKVIQSVALVPPFTAGGMNSSYFEAMALISVAPNVVITALLRPSKEAVNGSYHHGNGGADTLIHFRQILELPAFELDYVLSIKRWNRRSTRHHGSNNNNGTCTFVTNLVPNSTSLQVVSGEVFQLNTLRMAFLVCIDQQYGIVKAISDMSASPSGVDGGVMQFTTPSYILSAHKQEVTVVSLGHAFNAALSTNGASQGVAWHALAPFVQYQDASLLSPRRAKASNYSTSLPANGLPLSSYYHLELFAVETLGSGVLLRDIQNGGVPVWDARLGVVCNQSSSFLVVDEGVAPDLLTGLTTVCFACLHSYDAGNATLQRPPTVKISVITIILNVSSPGSVPAAGGPPPTVLQTPPLEVTLRTQPPPSATIVLDHQLPEIDLIQLTMMSCYTSLAPTGDSATACRMLIGLNGVDMIVATPRVDPSSPSSDPTAYFTFVGDTFAAVHEAVGMQLSQDGHTAFLLSTRGITSIDVSTAEVVWVSNTTSVCRPAEQLVDTIPSDTPCHIEVVDELCDYGGACTVILVGYDNDGVPNMQGFNSTGTSGDPLWRLLPQNTSLADPTVLFLSELLAPTQKWNSKVYLYSAFNLSVTCYSVRETASGPSALWTTALIESGNAVVQSFLSEVLDAARGTERNPCFGILRVSDFGIVVAVLRCSLPFQEATTSIWRIATYSLMLGLDAFTGAVLWSVEPLTYDVLSVTASGSTIIHQPRSFLADEVRGYVLWNSTMIVTELSASPYFANTTGIDDTLWFHSQLEEERNVVSIDVLNGSLLFQIPVARPSNISTENEFGVASVSQSSSIPGAVPSPSALLLSLVPSTSILMITEFSSRTLWATDVALFPLGRRITEVQNFFSARQPSLEAFYFFGTLDSVPATWRPVVPLEGWACTTVTPYAALDLQDLGAGAVSLSVTTRDGSCDLGQGAQLLGILNWTALPRPFDSVWRSNIAQRVAAGAPLLGTIRTLSVPGQGLSGRFDFELVRDTGIDVLDLSSNELAGVLTSFDGLPATAVWINLSNQTLYAGDQLPGAPTSTLFTSLESLAYLQGATSLQHLDLSRNILSARIARDFLLYIPPSLTFLNLSDGNLYGQLFDLASPVDNTSGFSSVNTPPNHQLSDRALRAMMTAEELRNRSASNLQVLDVSFNHFHDDATSSRLMAAYCSDLYAPSLSALYLNHNLISSTTTPNFFSINTTGSADLIRDRVAQCALNVVDLSFNNISGLLSLASAAQRLVTLNMSHNDLRDVVDISALPTLWHSNLSVVDVTGNPLVAGVVAPECPPRHPAVLYDTLSIPCSQNNGGLVDALGPEAICSNVRNSSMILPFVNPITRAREPGMLMMFYTQNQTSDPAKESITNCTLDTNRLLRFADGRIGYLDLFVQDTAPCLPRNMKVLEAFIGLTSSPPSASAGGGALFAPPADVNTTSRIANISIRYFRNASDFENRTTAAVATDLPGPNVTTYWCNYTIGSCKFLTGSYCMLDTDSTPYRLTASVAEGVTLLQYGGYSQSILTTQVCPYNATPVMVLPVPLGGSTLYPNHALLAPLVNCLPTTLGEFNSITLDNQNQIEIQDSTPEPAQFGAQICEHLPSPVNCPMMPQFTPPTSIAQAQAAQTCTDGYCAGVRSIMWSPCGTSIWDYDGFYPVGQCHALSDILRLPMQSVKDPPRTPCVFANDPPTCAQYAGLWTAFGVDLFLQAIQPQFFNNSLIPIYKDNCEVPKPACSSPENSTMAPNITDGALFCDLLQYLSLPPTEIMVAGYCDARGGSVFLTTCGPGGPQIPILQLNSSTCQNGIQAYCSACLPYIEPRATSLPYTFMIISSLKDILFILIGAYFLSKVWFRRPVTMCLTKLLLSITPLNVREKKQYADVLMARFNPLVIAPGELYDICDELLIKDDERRREYRRRKGSNSISPDEVQPDGELYNEDAKKHQKADHGSVGSSHRSWREELTLDNFLRTIGLRKGTMKDMSLNAETEGGSTGIVSGDERRGGASIHSKRSNLSEPMLRETAGSSLDREHPMEQHSSTLFSEEGVLVDDNVDSEVLQHFYRYYREAVCEHSRRQIGNVNHPLVRQRFQRLFEVYTEMFHKSQFSRERLMSNVFLDIDNDELDVDESKNFYSSFVVTSRTLTDPRASKVRRRQSMRGGMASQSTFSVQSSDHPQSSMQLARSMLHADRFSSLPPSSTRRSAIHELNQSFVRDRDAGAAGSPMGSPRARNSMGEEMVTIAPMATDKEVQILEALEEELQLAKEELFDVCEMVPILLVPTMVDARFTPQAWMLFVEAFYCVLYFLICVYESATVPGYTAWLVYSAVYFRYVNSCASVGLVVNALLRRVYLDEPLFAYDPFIVTALALMGPAIFSHIIPGIVLYCWIHILVLVVWLPCCWVMRQLEKRFFYTLDPISILFRVCFRLGTTIVATLLLQSSYNWALLYFTRKDDLGYLGIIEYEYDSRTWSCLIESRLQSLANVVQFLSAFV